MIRINIRIVIFALKYLFLPNLLFAIYFYKKNRHGLHILQLENYYNDRYLAWMKNNLKTVFDVKAIGLLIIPMVVMYLFNFRLGFWLNIIAYLTLIFTSKRPKEKKPFVATSRINRMAVTYAIIILAICYISMLYGIYIANICAIFAYVFVYIVNLINRPVEKAIRAGFCRKATKNLESIKGLEVVGITEIGRASCRERVLQVV